MPDKRIKLQFQGRDVEGEKVFVESMREDWNEYILTDQTVLRVRIILHDVVRLIGEYTSEGDPIYQVKTTNILSSDVPESLKRPGKE